MKIGIVTPSYNSAATIEETIQSVLSQAEEGVDLEYIIMDGGSTDGTVEIIKKYESRLKWWKSERDSGQVEALNKAFPRLEGEVLGFLNADDVFMPGALKKIAESFAAHPDADIIHGGVQWIDFEGRPLGKHLGRIESLEDVLDIFNVWWGNRQWAQPEVFFRRALKERIGIFDERYDLAFDYDFWVRCFREGARVERLDTPLVKFRRHAGQKSADAKRTNEQLRDIVLRHLDEGAGIGWWTALQLRAQLSYDLYQTGASDTRHRHPNLTRALLLHPYWLLCKDVRSRISCSFQYRLALI
jgi:glycosyltransferase involved in cell wall biosynthesis